VIDTTRISRYPDTCTPPVASANREVGDIPASGIIFKDSIKITAFEDPKVRVLLQTKGPKALCDSKIGMIECLRVLCLQGPGGRISRHSRTPWSFTPSSFIRNPLSSSIHGCTCTTPDRCRYLPLSGSKVLNRCRRIHGRFHFLPLLKGCHVMHRILAPSAYFLISRRFRSRASPYTFPISSAPSRSASRKISSQTQRRRALLAPRCV
jgi:hypothetical protein